MGDNEARREAATVDLSGVDRSRWTQPSRDRTECRTCNAPIRFVRTTTGALMPINEEPDPEGLVEITDAGAVVHGQPDLFATGVRYTSHFATCPDAEGWRRAR